MNKKKFKKSLEKTVIKQTISDVKLEFFIWWYRFFDYYLDLTEK